MKPGEFISIYLYNYIKQTNNIQEHKIFKISNR